MEMPEDKCVFISNWVKSSSRLFLEPPTTCIHYGTGSFHPGSLVWKERDIGSTWAQPRL